MKPDAVRDAERAIHGGSDDPDVLDFSANVNPRTPDGTREVYESAFDASRRYPDDGYPAFREAAAASVDCRPEQVVPTPGGLATIRLAIATGIEQGDDVLLPAPSFAEYAREVELQGANAEFVAPTAVVDADPAPYETAVVCQPNNPTGEAVPPDRLRAFAERCRAAGTELLVDEAFLDYTEFDSLAGEPGVVVARSLTKMYGLPGIRAGFAVATGDRLDDLRTARRPWALSTPAAAVGEHCLTDEAFVADTRERVVRERERLREAIAAEFDGRDSAAPFLLFDAGEVGVDAVVDRAKKRGVAVRDARSFRGLDNHVRVAVREPDANDRLLWALDLRDRPSE